MSPSILIAIVLSSLIGLSLGLLGGGGSILTVPILIYALGVEEKAAIASSLLVVAVTSAIAAVQHARANNVVWRVAFVFAGAGMVGAFVGGQSAQFVAASVLLVLFALVMFGAAFAMWRGRKATTATEEALPLSKMLMLGVVVGLVSGLVGAGGGFVIVPALALSGGLSMPKAVGSSLVVIALNSFAGFAGAAAHVTLDYRLIALVTTSAVVGSFFGAAIAKRVAPKRVRKGFAIFVFVMAVFLLFKQAQAFFV